jgi:hypothetical protein
MFCKIIANFWFIVIPFQTFDANDEIHMWICDINSLFFFRGKNNKFYMYLYVVL